MRMWIGRGIGSGRGAIKVLGPDLIDLVRVMNYPHGS